MNFDDEVIPGLTKWFIITAWNDLLSEAGGYTWIIESWYKPPEHSTPSNLWQIKCGAYIIGIAKSKKTLKVYGNWHKKLRAKYVKHQSTSEIAAKSHELLDIFQEIRQRLLEFSDMDHLPGHCDLC